MFNKSRHGKTCWCECHLQTRRTKRDQTVRQWNMFGQSLTRFNTFSRNTWSCGLSTGSVLGTSSEDFAWTIFKLTKGYWANLFSGLREPMRVERAPEKSTIPRQSEGQTGVLLGDNNDRNLCSMRSNSGCSIITRLLVKFHVILRTCSCNRSLVPKSSAVVSYWELSKAKWVAVFLLVLLEEDSVTQHTYFRNA